jgi:rod shape-determining protein MreC
MSRWTFWTDRSRQFIALACAVVISIVLLTLGRNEKTYVVKALTISILAPVQRGISVVAQLWEVYFQNQQLRKLNIDLSLENQMLREAQLENRRLRQLLSFRESEKLTSTLLAEVIAEQPSRQMSSILIGCGWQLGVAPNMAVVTSQGLVGRVVETYRNTSLVQLLKDRNCPVSAMVRRSRVSGILTYEGGADFLLKNVPWRMDVVEGDEVISSGLGGVFPKGLRLGTVTRVLHNERNLFKEIVVESSVDFNSLEEVFVILNVPQVVEGGEE